MVVVISATIDAATRNRYSTEGVFNYSWSMGVRGNEKRLPVGGDN